MKYIIQYFPKPTFYITSIKFYVQTLSPHFLFVPLLFVGATKTYPQRLCLRKRKYGEFIWGVCAEGLWVWAWGV